MAKYPYILLPGSKAIYRPYVQLWLSNPHNQKQSPRIRGLIDSDADVCLASKDIALWLGIQFDEQAETIPLEPFVCSTSQQQRIGRTQPFGVIGVEGFVHRQDHDIVTWSRVLAIQ